MTKKNNVKALDAFAVKIPDDFPALLSGTYDEEAGGVDIGNLESLPYLMFFDKKSNLAGTIQNELGVGLTAGERILVIDEDTFIRANSAAFLSLREITYYAVVDTDDKGKLIRASFEEPEDKFNSPLKEHIMSVLLAFLPERDRPVVTLTTFRSTKTQFMRDHLRAVAKSKSPKWAAKSELNGAVAGALAERYRIVTVPFVTTRQGRKDPETGKPRPYIKATGRPRTITLDEAKKLKAWFDDPACIEDAKRFEGAFKSRLDYIKNVVAEPAA